MSVRLDQLKASMTLDEKAFERSEHDAKEWQKILQHPIKFPDGRVFYLRDIESNFYICRGDCYPQDLTLASIVLLIQNDPSFLHDTKGPRLSFADAETIKQELIDKICEYLEQTTEAPGVVENRRKLMAFWSLENLRKELLRVESVANLHEKPVTWLRRIVSADRPVSGYPELPRKIMMHGELVKLDAARIKSLDRDSLKTLIRKWGADQINARLRGE